MENTCPTEVYSTENLHFRLCLITKSKEKIEMICESTTFVLSCCHFSQFSCARPRNFSLRPEKKRHLLRRLRILSQIVPFSLESRQAPALLNIFFTALRNSRLRME